MNLIRIFSTSLLLAAGLMGSSLQAHHGHEEEHCHCPRLITAADYTGQWSAKLESTGDSSLGVDAAGIISFTIGRPGNPREGETHLINLVTAGPGGILIRSTIPGSNNLIPQANVFLVSFDPIFGWGLLRFTIPNMPEPNIIEVAFTIVREEKTGKIIKLYSGNRSPFDTTGQNVAVIFTAERAVR